MNTTHDAIRERLRDVKAAISEARNERAAAGQALDQAQRSLARVKASADELTRTSEWRHAQRAKDERDAAQDRLEDLVSAEKGLLEQLGQSSHNRGGADRNGPMNREDFESTWPRVAHELAAGRSRVDEALGDLVRPPMLASVTVTPSSGLTVPTITEPLMQKARDERFLWMAFRTEQIESSDLGVSDYRQTGSRTVTGDVERDTISTAEKARLSLEVELETVPLRTLAVYLDGIPSKLLDAVPQFPEWCVGELKYQTSRALSTHCINQMAEAAVPVGQEGEGLWVQVRNAAKVMRAQGAKPTVLALSPDDAAELDTMTAGADHLPVFALRDVGSSSPLFGLNIIEVPNLEAPLLIDPSIAGILYLGAARVLADPFTGLAKNEVRIRVEAEALLHIRDIAGLYSIEGE